MSHFLLGANITEFDYIKELPTWGSLLNVLDIIISCVVGVFDGSEQISACKYLCQHRMGEEEQEPSICHPYE